MLASSEENLDVVNRLLDCKQIDVNVLNSVSQMLMDDTSHLLILFPYFFFFYIFLNQNFENYRLEEPH